MLVKPTDMTKELLKQRKSCQTLRKGISTGFPELDELILLNKTYLLLCTGNGGSGKSEYLDAIALNTAISEGWKWVFFSPENFPMEAHLRKHVERYAGKGLWEMLPKEIEDACEYLEQYMTWINPPDEQQSPEALTDWVGEAQAKNGCDAYVFDPWNELDHSAGSNLRDDQYISVALTKIRKFNRKNNLLGCIVIHPKGLQRDRDGNYPVPTLSDCHGGIMWRNKCDYGICLNRADMSKDKVTLYIQKIKFKTQGHVGAVDLEYHKASGRFKTANQTEFLLPLQVESPF
jgi:twinkle protein